MISALAFSNLTSQDQILSQANVTWLDIDDDDAFHAFSSRKLIECWLKRNWTVCAEECQQTRGAKCAGVPLVGSSLYTLSWVLRDEWVSVLRDSVARQTAEWSAPLALNDGRWTRLRNDSTWHSLPNNVYSKWCDKHPQKEHINNGTKQLSIKACWSQLYRTTLACRCRWSTPAATHKPIGECIEAWRHGWFDPLPTSSSESGEEVARMRGGRFNIFYARLAADEGRLAAAVRRWTVLIEFDCSHSWLGSIRQYSETLGTTDWQQTAKDEDNDESSTELRERCRVCFGLFSLRRVGTFYLWNTCCACTVAINRHGAACHCIAPNLTAKHFGNWR